FAGMTFYEIRAKSLINRIKGGGRFGFEFTINPYRGCTHACTYCLAGDSQILLPDGTTKSLDALVIGDAIIGTVRDGRSRRYTVTSVRGKWPTVKWAYRLRLANGVSLTASSEHRFLSDTGWKHVTASVAGPDRRPYLAVGDHLLGVAEPLPLARLQESRLAPVQVTAIEPMRLEMPMWDITTGTGDFIANGVVSHNCFARNTHTYLDLDAGHDFDSKIVVKVNAVEVLQRELAARSWGGESIAMGTNVDCYQRAEGRYHLMPGIISTLSSFKNPFSILTKGTLILRDLPLLQEAATRTRVSVAFSIGFLDEELWRLVESGTPSPMRRLAAVSELTDAGFRISVLMAPILPGLTDDEASIEATVSALASAGAASVTPLVLHLRPGAREWFMGWLSQNRPDLLPLYQKIYRDRSYASNDFQRLVTARVRRAMRRYGLSPGSDTPARDLPVTHTQPTLL
ncbi:MAG TPA: radical SAM protein, partial [Micromonosporaceae bacterium]|nr:radical SAM protein [Micromonosporaceae bacterium]